MAVSSIIQTLDDVTSSSVGSDRERLDLLKSATKMIARLQKPQDRIQELMYIEVLAQEGVVSVLPYTEEL